MSITFNSFTRIEYVRVVSEIENFSLHFPALTRTELSVGRRRIISRRQLRLSNTASEPWPCRRTCMTAIFHQLVTCGMLRNLWLLSSWPVGNDLTAVLKKTAPVTHRGNGFSKLMCAKGASILSMCLLQKVKKKFSKWIIMTYISAIFFLQPHMLHHGRMQSMVASKPIITFNFSRIDFP